MESEEKRPFNPLKAVWNIISTISGAVGLVSFADSFYSWNDVFDQMITVYRGIVHWPFEWVPFEIANWVKDYLFMGAIFGGAFMKTFYKAESKSDAKETFIALLLISFPIFGIASLIWPGFLIYSIYTIIKRTEFKKGDLDFRYTASLMAAILLVFLCFLLASIILNR